MRTFYEIQAVTLDCKYKVMRVQGLVKKRFLHQFQLIESC